MAAEVQEFGEQTNSLAANQAAGRPAVARLIARLRKMPEIRQERLEQVAGRLQRGEYLTAEAARLTAEAILRTGG